MEKDAAGYPQGHTNPGISRYLASRLPYVVRFGGGRMEKDAAGYPSRLTHTGSRTPASDGTSPAAYPTRIVGSLKPFRWNPAGNQSRPVEPDQQPEASLAWWVGDHPCEA